MLACVSGEGVHQHLSQLPPRRLPARAAAACPLDPPLQPVSHFGLGSHSAILLPAPVSFRVYLVILPLHARWSVEAVFREAGGIWHLFASLSETHVTNASLLKNSPNLLLSRSRHFNYPSGHNQLQPASSPSQITRVTQPQLSPWCMSCVGKSLEVKKEL